MLNSEICLRGKDYFKLYVGMDADINTDNFAHGWSLFKLCTNLK